MNHRELETMLTAGYAEQAECYTHALAELDAAAPAVLGDDDAARADASDDTDADAWLLRLCRRLDEVRGVEARLARVRAAWQRAGAAPGRELAATLGKVTTSIQALQARLEKTLGDLNARPDRLGSQPDDAIPPEHRRRALQRATG